MPILDPLIADILNAHHPGAQRQRKPPRIPPGASSISVRWLWRGEGYEVDGYYVRGSPGRGPTLSGPGEPPEPGEFQPLAIVDDYGEERPELIEDAEQDVDALTAAAEDALRDEYEAAEEDAADAARDDRRMRWER